MTEAYYTGFGMIIVLKNVSFVWVCTCVWFVVDRPDARNIEKKVTVGQVLTCQIHSRAKHKETTSQETQGISTATIQIIQMNSGEHTAIKPLTWPLLLCRDYCLLLLPITRTTPMRLPGGNSGVNDTECSTSTGTHIPELIHAVRQRQQ